MYYITTLFYKCIRTSDNAAAARVHESSIVYILTVCIIYSHMTCYALYPLKNN